MNKYIITDKVSGEVLQTISWGDGREFPQNYPLQENEEMKVSQVEDNVEIFDMYDNKTNQFYILDITDNQVNIENIKSQLAEIELTLSDFQEATWTAMSINEAELPEIWQARLAQKRALREKLITM